MLEKFRLPNFFKKHKDNTVLYIITGVVIAILLNHLLSFALGTDMPIVAVESNSMVPTFSRGDMLILVGKPADRLDIGDIIVFTVTTETTPIVHRVVKKNPDGTLQTKGDANNSQLSFEKSIEAEQIHGVVLLIIPLLGWIKILLTDLVIPNIIFVLLGLAAAFLIYKSVKR